MKKRKMKSVDQAKPCKTQHKTPCCDCPFRRDSMPGWLGGMTADQYFHLAHSDEKIECHTKIGPQCAGAAIYRSNVCKRVRGTGILELPVNRDDVFGNPMDFLEHHRTN